MPEFVNITIQGRDVTLNGDPRVGKLTFKNLKMSNSPGVARTPHPGANH